MWTHAHIALYEYVLHCTKMHSLLFIAHNSVVVASWSMRFLLFSPKKKLDPWFRKRFMGSVAMSIYKYKYTFKAQQANICDDPKRRIHVYYIRFEHHWKEWNDKKASKVNTFYECHGIEETVFLKKKKKVVAWHVCMCISASRIEKRYKTTKKCVKPY